MDRVADFDETFCRLTGHAPFPWQQELYRRFTTGPIPSSCDIPTGLGKTAVVAIWLIALARHPDKLPRRLVYVVNRRTVVDQTTDEVERLRTNLRESGLWDTLKELCAVTPADEPPLAISTLRGQFADNREWSADPCRPAVIVGTVDMIGSRLLFSGYRIGFKERPLHAGFLGQNSLLVHDEAHLEPAFQELIEQIHFEQQEREHVGQLPWHKFQIMALTATSRNDNTKQSSFFELTDAEKNPPAQVPDSPTEPIHVAWRRIKAQKTIRFVPIDDEKKELANRIAALALERFRSSGEATLVFARTVEDVDRIVNKLNKEKQQVQQLTGTMRGLERDDLPKDPIFGRFLLPSGRPEGVTPAEGTVYLVCTSAGEVGVNISADHLVCDLTTFESMAQRFGRVNRFGNRSDAEIQVVHPKEFDQKDPYEQRRQKTLELLQQLNGDGSPAALASLDSAARLAAFSPEPIIPPVTDILFDAWALTTIRAKLPGRPPVEPYLHGLEDEKRAETHVAWRQEVWELRRLYHSDDERKAFEKFAAELLEDYRLKPHELLRDSTFRKASGIRDKLLQLAQQHPDFPVWVQQLDGSVTVATMARLSDLSLPSCTVLLPPEAGGLLIPEGRSSGVLSGEAPFQPECRHLYDVADEWRDERGRPRRCRNVWDEDDAPEGMRLVRTIDTNLDADEFAEEGEAVRAGRFWRWYVQPRSADDDSSRTSLEAVPWDNHTRQVTEYAERIAARTRLADDLQQAIRIAAEYHDRGKQREVWQRGIGNPNPKEWYAKSGKDPVTGRRWTPRDDICPDYRHEFGSMLDVEHDPAFQTLSDDLRDMVLHLIAAHHGRGRPHFPSDEVLDPDHTEACAVEAAAEVPRRFARLQRKYGRWGLAYLESLLRAADWAASANPTSGANSTNHRAEDV